MHAALVTGHRTLDFIEFPEPAPSPGRAVVEIAYCGICGTDLHAWASGEPYNPAICGHEWVGHVRAVGAGVDHVREGDRVAIGVAAACGRCRACAGGDAAHCEAAFAGMIGVGPLAAPHGGFAPAIAFDAARLYVVDHRLSDEAAALLEPLAVAVHAVRRTPIQLGDTTVVLGGGPIGLLVMQCARAAGAGTVVLVEPQPARADRARALGVDAVLDPRAGDLKAQLEPFIGSRGADVVFECAGIAATVEQSVMLARRGGVVSLVGVSDQPATITPSAWLVQEVRLSASLGYLHHDFAIAQQLAADRRVQLAPLHTSTVPLAAIGDAFERLATAPAEVKILVDPRAAR